MQGIRRILLIMMLLFVGGTYTVSARDDFIEVSHQELLEYPQKYWSQAIIFEDVLTGMPKGRSIRLGEQEYIPFKTKNLGTCYIGKELIPLITEEGINKNTIFQGTVLHQPSSFFSRRPSFYVVVQRLTPAVDGVELAQQELFKATDAVRYPASSELVSQIQQNLISYARQNDMSLAALFSDEEARAKVANIIYSSIAGIEQQEGVTARKILGDFILEVFVAEYGKAAMPVPAKRVPEQGSTPVPAPVHSAQQAEKMPVPAQGEEEQQAVSPSQDIAAGEVPVKGESLDAEQQRIEKLRQRVALLLKPGVGMIKSAPEKAPLSPNNEGENKQDMQEPSTQEEEMTSSEAVTVEPVESVDAGEELQIDEEDPLADIFADDEDDAKVFRNTPQE